MKTRTLPGAAACIMVVGVLAFAGCSDDPNTATEPDPEGAGSDATAAFVACVASADVEADINAHDQVLVEIPAEASGGAGILSGADDDGLRGVELDEEGDVWERVGESSDIHDNAERL